MGSSLVPIMLIVVLLVALVIFLYLNNRPVRQGNQRPRRGLNHERHQSGTVPVRDDPDTTALDDLPGFDEPDPAPAVAAPAVESRATGGRSSDTHLARVYHLGGGADDGPADGGAGADRAGEEPPGSARASDAGSDGDGAASPNSAGRGAHDPRASDPGMAEAGSVGTAGAPWGGEVTAKVPAGEFGRGSDPDATGWTPPPATPPHQVPSYDDDRQNTTRYYDPQTGDFPIAPPTTTYTPQPATPEPAAQAGTGDPRWESSPTATTFPGMTPPPRRREHAADLVAAEPDEVTAAPLRLAAAGRTRRGKRGGPNEDAFVVVDGLLAVADGVGGEAAGQIASTLTVTTVAGFRPQYAEDPLEGLRKAVERANRVVRTRAREEPTWLGMACTLDVVILGRQRSTGEYLTVAHVGDSSVWLQPGRGRPRALTTPHAIRNGPLLNAVGLADEIEADIFSEPVRAGDRVVLASDGITKVMTPEQLDGLMSELGSSPPERAADALVEAALLAGARDDTTIVVADLVSEPTGR
ncbi:protein phosphatase 2C domain-containing protein [Frankia sp. AgKG'84/4]|uniref:protein phosphatase 2C domain-containing protein n=1 Tax=Frankia sp. AgKG'84/4 TaxID=573490 RepID=UPI00200FBA6A|nr:PP2C family serine/threonine-protein phosphatase [Frankia sp. AgKG'84/4]MCL9795226.1 protein phosphatase 2C domain-containing protein [Frankia sp. AgKG'84/4]